MMVAVTVSGDPIEPGLKSRGAVGFADLRIGKLRSNSKD